MASLRKKVKDLEINAKKRRKADFDPEDDAFSKQPESDDESEGSESLDENTGREHYQAVGKSKLRKPEKSRLDEKKYGGSAVSRDKVFQDDDDGDALAFEDDEDEDPFAVRSAQASESEGEEEADHESENESLDGEDVDGEGHEDEEIDSDEAFEDGEEDKFRGKGFVFRGSGQDLKTLPAGSDEDEDQDARDESATDEIESMEEDESDTDMEDFDENEESQEEDVEDEEESEDEEEDESTAHPRPSTMKSTGNSDREKLKALISHDTATLASSLSATLSADAQKGTAVKKQYQTFDRLLDARIKLQKGLTASNDLISPGGSITDEDAQTALRNAEAAALKLYATIESLRHSILEANLSNARPDSSTKKRKRPTPPTLSTSTSDLWTRTQDLETQSLPIRRQILDKWSTKTRSAAPIPSTASKLTNADQKQSKLSTVLDAYLHSESARLQTASQPQTQTQLDSTDQSLAYDDSPFYQSLLRDLINSRAATTNLSGQSNFPVLPLKLHPSGNAAKNRKVDTKASKGRKVRYTVHEKLENFMAGEGRGGAVGQWNDGAVREFFASLLGQRGMLGEGEGDGMDRVDGDREGEALRLFRT